VSRAPSLLYGRSWSSAPRSPRPSSREPMDAAARPLPRDEITPPVTNTNFGVTRTLLSDVGHVRAARIAPRRPPSRRRGGDRGGLRASCRGRALGGYPRRSGSPRRGSAWRGGPRGGTNAAARARGGAPPAPGAPPPPGGPPGVTGGGAGRGPPPSAWGSRAPRPPPQPSRV